MLTGFAIFYGLPIARRNVQKGPSSKTENAAGGLFHHSPITNGEKRVELGSSWFSC